MKKPSPEKSQKAKKAQEESKNRTKDTQPVEKEVGGFADQNLPEPTRFGDWEVKGRCSDF